MRATLESPEATTPRTSLPRKRRCRMLNRDHNRCSNEVLSDFGLCLRHLCEAADEWRHVAIQYGLIGA